MKQYFQEFQSAPVIETAAQRDLRHLAEEYHHDTEAFDQIHCTGRSARGIAIPLTLGERLSISHNASLCYQAGRIKAERLGFNEAEWQQMVITTGDLLEGHL